MSAKVIKIGIKEGDTIYKATSIYLLSDGSFKVDVPYCKYDKGLIIKIKIGYGGGMHVGRFEEEFSISDRSQLSVHTSGLIHFSGKGILSGIDENGKIKGVGVKSLPLNTPISDGPTFGIQIWGLEKGFEKYLKKEKCDIVYGPKDFIVRKDNPEDELNTYILEGWILPPNKRLMSYCITKENSKEKITLSFPQYIHSPGAIFTLDIIRLKKLNSFIGIGPFTTNTGFALNHPYGFILSGPTEPSKDNPKERMAMFAISPKVMKDNIATLDWI
ncbi:MAG: hypothetical protein COU10_03900 [Candidatus Harrisonbacteria bacterium CG10_big_fil_rev_8_21_14_0_10_45_28]|uniref:Uncharacterized protein n=1 Tax=Candidatus Harrisonbacteria bacterium CG10_big_fil_rev_8_21_14_0_10_45_28 TaxID=1974586 RepID=A0A2H0UPH8_9BACT|nr:MAG: hypothetical protein COU10_03900 [Candidatus Harrisonbacteria bacterium CG10_big_fil_rev_8_21_14_0_10_45_28]